MESLSAMLIIVAQLFFGWCNAEPTTPASQAEARQQG